MVLMIFNDHEIESRMCSIQVNVKEPVKDQEIDKCAIIF